MLSDVTVGQGECCSAWEVAEVRTASRFVSRNLRGAGINLEVADEEGASQRGECNGLEHLTIERTSKHRAAGG